MGLFLNPMIIITLPFVVGLFAEIPSIEYTPSPCTHGLSKHYPTMLYLVPSYVLIPLYLSSSVFNNDRYAVITSYVTWIISTAQFPTYDCIASSSWITFAQKCMYFCFLVFQLYYAKSLLFELSTSPMKLSLMYPTCPCLCLQSHRMNL